MYLFNLFFFFFFLSFTAPDGTEVPLLTSGNKPWTLNVDVGGDISVTQQSYSGKLSIFFSSLNYYSFFELFFWIILLIFFLDDDQVSFFVEFELSCQQKKLRGAQLLAVVHLNNERSLQVPVAVGAHGRYQVSWLLNNKDAVSGDYKIDVYRNVDKKRNEAAEPFLSITHNHVVCFLIDFFFFRKKLESVCSLVLTF